MISLITGVPGSGKTAWLVNELMTNNALKDRPIYVCGIPELLVDHETITTQEAQDWPDWAPTGAIIIIDECQKVFRPRRSGSDVPKYISEFETHRHRGLDFYLLTQNPRLIDSNVRDLVGEHRHISKTIIGIRRMLYWNTGGAKNPAARRDIAEAITSVYFLPRKTFGMYKSAEEHTDIKGKKSKAIIALPFILALTGYGFYSVYNRYKEAKAPPAAASEAAASVAVGDGAALAIQEPTATGTYSASPASAPASGQLAKIDPESYLPVMDGKPWTAPVYAPHNTTITTMPYPVACVKNGSRCTCYTDQATPIQGMDKGLCLDFVENGIYNPHKQPRQADTGQAAATVAPDTAASVLSPG